MKALKPLLFLLSRTIFNGVKRSLTTPRRLISLIIFIGYYFFIFIRPALTSSEMPVPNVGDKLSFPPMEAIQALTFGTFSVLSLFMLLGVTSYLGTFKPADVDVLFSTPISPRVVLTFRILRDFLITLIFPFLMAIVGLRPIKTGWEAIFKNMPNPEYAGMTFRALTIGWILMSVAWVVIGYAVSLFINRSDLKSERNMRILWTVIVGMVGTATFVMIQGFQSMQSVNDLIAMAQNPILRTIFFTATLAEQLALAPLNGSWTQALIGVGGLVGITLIALRIAMTQADWMYDQAAVKGFATQKIREIAKSGDMMQAVAERARQGKFKVRGLNLAKRFKSQGASALVLKEIILQFRGSLGMFITFAILGGFMVIFPAIIPESSRRPGVEVSGYALMGMQAMTIFMITMSFTQVGFIEVLRRVDLQKPMPFSAQRIVFMEVVAKAVPGALTCILGSLIAFILKPTLWAFALGGAIASTMFSLLLSAVGFAVVMLFPDLDDPSQRQFRGLMMLLGSVIAVAFPAGTIVGLIAGFKSPVLASLIGGAMAFGIAWVVSIVGGSLYASFNPSE
ncbi:MAG TPA: putative ABC exporter domain-containing protein [Fimbriimonadaceae bacterium]|nr:putative ABC exporter domain-containing protein [Fimbriimonadaceae bacterium]